MGVEITVDGKKRSMSIKGKIRVADLLSKLEISEQMAIVKVNRKIVTEFDYVSPGDRVELVRVSTGG